MALEPSSPPASSETVETRVRGERSRPCLVYLPGTHGDSTMVTAFRKRVQDRLCFVELTYPRTRRWSLEDYARGVDEALARAGVREGWLLGESFGSQIAWPMTANPKMQFRTRGVILAGGFVRHPWMWSVRRARALLLKTSVASLRRAVAGYIRFAKLRYATEPDVLERLDEFVRRRTDEDRLAAAHRLALIADNDLRPLAEACRAPVYSLVGFFDPIVPWPPVAAWLRDRVPGFQERRVFFQSDHNVLNMASRKSAEWAANWIARHETEERALK